MKQARSLVVIVSSAEASVGECNDCIRQSHTHTSCGCHCRLTRPKTSWQILTRLQWQSLLQC